MSRRLAVQEAPLYYPAVPVDRDAEIGIDKHYGQTGSWTQGEARRVA